MDFITSHPLLAIAAFFGIILVLFAAYTAASILAMMVAMDLTGITSSFGSGFDAAVGMFVGFHILLLVRRKLRKKDVKAAATRQRTLATVAPNPSLGAVSSLPALRQTNV